MKTSNTLPVLFLSVLMTACGGGGGSEKTTTPPTPLANVAPSVNSGDDQLVNQGAIVTLSGSGSDSDGTVSSYNWVQLSGIVVSLSDSSSAVTTFTAPDSDEKIILTFELTVTDDDNASSSNTVEISIQPLPKPTNINLTEQKVILEKWEDQHQISILSVTDQMDEAIDDFIIVWDSSDPTIATVKSGLIKSGKAGEAIISVVASNENGSISKDVSVSVTNQSNDACIISSPPNRGSIAPAKTYTEIDSNTSAKGNSFSYAIDLNGDNKDDMFWLSTFFDDNTLEQPSEAAVWLSQGNGDFIDATSIYLPEGLNALDVPRQIYTADIDGDSDNDYVILQHGYDPGGQLGLDCSNVDCPGAPNLIVSMGDDGKLRDTASTALSPYDTNGFTHAGGVADVECDGDIDILEGQLGNELASAPNRLQINDGSGKFTADDNAFPSNFTTMGGFYGGAFCDLDGDGDPDVYMAQNGAFRGTDSADVIFTNDGFGNFRLLSGKRFDESRLGEDNQLPADTRCFDFDGDGLNDLLKPNETADLKISFELLRNNGDMTFTDVTDSMLPNSPPANGSYRPIIVDLNDDDWPDILAHGTADYLRIYWNKGSGFSEFKFPNETAISTRGASITYGDFDGDNDIDIHISRGEYEAFLLKSK